MSRGIGGLQRRVIDEVARSRGRRILWDELKERFPREAAQRSLHRGVRGVLGRGLIYEQWIGDRRWLGLTVSGDTELLDVCHQALRMLEMAAKARKVPVPEEAAALRQEVDAYRRGARFGD